jgi:hypothetical protein
MKNRKRKEITLDDVQPMHPNEYPAKHLREILDHRREELHEITESNRPRGMPDGPGPLT